MFNKISKSIILTLEVCCIAIMLLSCNNFLNPNKSTFIPETITTEKAYIDISAKFSRTILPQTYNESSRGLSWTLSVTKLGESNYYEKTWNDDNATTAYQRMINTKDISLESGEYTFTLVASLNGLKVLESTLQQTLISGKNTLSFSMQEATGDDIATGQIDFTLNWTVDNIISKVVSTFQEYNGNEISTETNDRISENSYNFTKTDVTPGLYLLKIELQQMDPITKINETINRYSCLVRVAPGLVSSGEATIQSLAPLYTINYILNEGALQSGITQVSYNSYTSFELPIPEKSGFNFVGWYTDENLTQKVENNKYTLTSDITLYAKWEKQRILDDGYVIGDQDDDKNVVDSTKASFDSSNGYGILTVNNPGESSSVWDYYIEKRNLFSDEQNYLVSVDLKTDDSDTVVGIAAANCDMFFTVGTEWQTYTFETGYLETATSNGITIGSALANKLYISDIVITPIDDDGLPTLSFNVTKTGIQNYLNQPDKPVQIIEVSKKDNNSGYEITINTPISSTDSSQNVTLQLRDYAYVGNMNKASFNLTSTDAALKTSIKGFSVNQEEIDNNNNKIKSWNTPATFQQNNTVFFPAFPNEENRGDLVPCVIEGILSSGTNSQNSTTITISGFIIEEATTDVIQSAGKTYTINIGNSWYKSYDLPLSANSVDDTTCQVLFRNDFDNSPNPDDWNECIRFLYDGQTGENFTLGANKKVTLNEDFTISVEDNQTGVAITASGINYDGLSQSMKKYSISNYEGLVTFRNIVNGTLLDSSTSSVTILASSTSVTDDVITSADPQTNIIGVLTTDIDLSGIEWIPIGSEEIPFTGDFNGQGNSVKNIMITNATTDNQGLFGVISSSSRKSNIKDIKVTGNITSTGKNVGGIVGNANNVYFENCANNATIKTSNIVVGGIAGKVNNVEFVSCVNLATIESTITSTDENVCVGGIAGYLSNFEATACYNAGNITATVSVGGLFGFESDTSKTNLTIESCINSGTVTGFNHLASILGYSSNSYNFDYCVNYGKIVSTSTNTFGCIIGTCNSSKKPYISECFVAGNVVTTGQFFIGNENANVTFTLYDKDKLSPKNISSSGGGEGLATTALKSSSITYINNNWYGDWICSNEHYPIPDVESDLPDYWDMIVEAATNDIPSGSGGGSSSGGTYGQMVRVSGTQITGTESWTPNSSVFVSGRNFTIPNLLVSDHEVTRGEYKAVMEIDPSTANACDMNGIVLTGDAVLNNPVTNVNWYTAIVYCNKLSEQEGFSPCYQKNNSTDTTQWGDVPSSFDSNWNAITCDFNANGYRLPTEAEWEWLARGGQNTVYAGSDNIDEVAWYTDNTNDQGTREVKTKNPNGYGLYDMSGNVNEWCWDWHVSSLSGYEFTGPSIGSERVVRGGDWYDFSYSSEVLNRTQASPYITNNTRGFRVVRTANE